MKKALSLLILIPALAAAMGAPVPVSGPMSGELPAAFDPAPVLAQGWPPAFDALNAWGRTELGANLLSAQPRLKAISQMMGAGASPASLSALSPLVQASARGKVGERLVRNMSRLATLAPAAQKREFAQIVKDFASAEAAAAPLVSAAVEELGRSLTETRGGISSEESSVSRSPAEPSRLASWSAVAESLSKIESLGLYGADPARSTAAAELRRKVEELKGKAAASEVGAIAGGVGAPVPVLVDAQGQPLSSGRSPTDPRGGISSEESSVSRGPTIIVPTHADVVKFGGESFPAVSFPTDGTDEPALIVKAHSLSDSADVAAYNFDLLAFAQSIVEASKQGKPQRFIGDFSNFLPNKLSQAEHGGQHQERTPAMQLLIDNQGPNLQLKILKGFKSFGINHNKFQLLKLARLRQRLKQGGSFNYTHTSQDNHWENVVVTDDGRRIDLDQAYFDWMWDLARPFSEDLEPENPVIDPAHPIPFDADPSQDFHGTKFPLQSYSPHGGTEGWLAKAAHLVRQEIVVLMFSPFPTDAEVAEWSAQLAAGRPITVIADSGQLHMAARRLLPLVKQGMELYAASGPNAMKNPGQPHGQHEKMHVKAMLFDPRLPDGLGKELDSTNDSQNAFNNNFENAGFWQGAPVAMLYELAQHIKSLARRVTADDLERMAAGHAASGGPRHLAESADPSKP